MQAHKMNCSTIRFPDQSACKKSTNNYKFQRTYPHMTKLRRPKPRQKELLLPFGISKKTKLFLPRSIGERMLTDIENIKQHHADYQPLTTPSGIKLTGPSLFGKIICLMERYTRKTNFFLKEANEHELKFTTNYPRPKPLLLSRGKGLFVLNCFSIV